MKKLLAPRFFQFLQFLKDKDALEKYMKNVDKCVGDPDRQTSAKSYVDTSFNWSKTPEKHAFWSEIHDSWHAWLIDNPPAIDWQDTLEQFLVENNCYQQYWRNVEEFDSVTENPFVREVEDLLDSVFDWSDSDEGDSFWSDINRKWYDKINGISTALGEDVSRYDVTITIPDDWAFAAPIPKAPKKAIPEPSMPGNVQFRQAK